MELNRRKRAGEKIIRCDYGSDKSLRIISIISIISIIDQISIIRMNLDLTDFILEIIYLIKKEEGICNKS